MCFSSFSFFIFLVHCRGDNTQRAFYGGRIFGLKLRIFVQLFDALLGQLVWVSTSFLGFPWNKELEICWGVSTNLT